MKIMIACGYYDMATPFYAAEYTVSSLNLDPTLRKNISFQYYESGHMVYIEKIAQETSRRRGRFHAERCEGRLERNAERSREV
jgi:carboxypeptidase C (cathepsin A)